MNCKNLLDEQLLEIDFELDADPIAEQNAELLDLMVILLDRLEKYDASGHNNEFQISRRFLIRSLKMLKRFF